MSSKRLLMFLKQKTMAEPNAVNRYVNSDANKSNVNGDNCVSVCIFPFMNYFRFMFIVICGMIRCMQIAISIEPYLAVEKSKLTQYIEDIVKLSREFQPGEVCLHFDYFKSNPEVFCLVQSYANQIDIDLHLMREPAPSITGFRSVSFDLTDVYNNKMLLNSQNSQLMNNVNCVDVACCGLVLDLGCEIRGYEDLIRSARYIIVMTVKCGKSGQTFHPEALKLIPQVRELNPNATIIIDGGVNENNIDLLKKAGVNVVVVGNYAKKCYENNNFSIGINRLLHK